MIENVSASFFWKYGTLTAKLPNNLIILRQKKRFKFFNFFFTILGFS